MKRLFALMLAMLLLLLCACEKTPATVATDPQTGEAIEQTCVHTDDNEDLVCDSCGNSVLVTFEVYGINDLHGKLDDTDSQPGVDELTTFIKNKRQDHNVLLISAGDMWQGSSESNLTKGQLTTEWMNDIGFDAMVMGNHEYDWGGSYVGENAQLAQFPFLAINIYDRATNQRLDYCKSSVMIDKNGVQIGIIGAIGDCYSSIAADQVKDVYFKTKQDLTKLVMDEATALREQGADFIIYALHDGYEESASGVTDVTGSQLSYYYDTALSNGYVDLVFEAHTHQHYMLQDEYGVYHLQNGGENKRGISFAELTINSVTGAYTVENTQLISTSAYAKLDADPIIDDLLVKYAEQVNRGEHVVGYNARQRSSGEMQQLVADLYYDVGMEAWGEEYDIVLGGGFISVRSPYNLSAGEVTYGMVQMLFPFDNQLHLCTIKGSDLKEKFFETDNDRYFIAYGQYGEDVRKKIDPNGTYYIVVDSYTSSYRYNNLTVVAEYTPEVYARDLICDYISTGAFE